MTTRLLIIASILALAGHSHAAESSQPVAGFIYPAGGQRGTTRQATISGQQLQKASAIHISGSGVTARILHATTLPAQPNRNSASLTINSTLTLALTIAPDAQPGLRDVRLLTPEGISNRIRFRVGQLPELTEAEPNSSLDQAQPITSLPATINGQTLEGDRDFYRFEAQAGDQIVCTVQARALLPYIADAVPGWNDPCLTLYGPDRREIQTVDDFRFHPDPVLIFRAPTTGQYTLEIKDILLRGRGDFVYRLSIGQLPFITHIFPLGAQRGSAARIQIFGVNLPSTRLNLPLPPSSPSIVPVSVENNGIQSNTLPLAVSDHLGIAEATDNDAPQAAHRITPPLAINGRIDTPADTDHFTFSAKRGQKLLIEVQARRLLSPMDSILTLFDTNGKKLAENDDTPDPEEGLLTHHADSRILHTFAADGDYVLRIADIQGKGGPEYAYRLIITPARPNFALRVFPDNPRAMRADSTPLTIRAIRKDGFNGPIQIAVHGLPDGFSVSPATIPAGQDKVTLTITIPPTAPLTQITPTITGQAMINGVAITRPALPAEELMQAFAYKHVLPSDELKLCINEPGPLSVSLAQPITSPFDLSPGEKLELRVKINRRSQEKMPVTLKPMERIRGLTIRGGFVPPDKDEATIVIQPTRQMPPRSTHNVILTALMRHGKNSITRTLPAIPIRVSPPPQRSPRAPQKASRPPGPPGKPKAP